jgi:hypothetical protein
MHWIRPALSSGPQFVAGHLYKLREHLGELAAQVRVAVADAVAATLARLARDIVDRLLCVRSASLSRPMMQHRPSDEFDPWAEPPDLAGPWSECALNAPVEPPRQEGQSRGPGRATVLSVALCAAGWWLRRGGRPAAALGVGLATALVAVAGGRPVTASLELAGATGELIALESAFQIEPTISTVR